MKLGGWRFTAHGLATCSTCRKPFQGGPAEPHAAVRSQAPTPAAASYLMYLEDCSIIVTLRKAFGRWGSRINRAQLCVLLYIVVLALRGGHAPSCYSSKSLGGARSGCPLTKSCAFLYFAQTDLCVEHTNFWVYLFVFFDMFRANAIPIILVQVASPPLFLFLLVFFEQTFSPFMAARRAVVNY